MHKQEGPGSTAAGRCRGEAEGGCGTDVFGSIKPVNQLGCLFQLEAELTLLQSHTALGFFSPPPPPCASTSICTASWWTVPGSKAKPAKLLLSSNQHSFTDEWQGGRKSGAWEWRERTLGFYFSSRGCLRCWWKYIPTGLLLWLSPRKWDITEFPEQICMTLRKAVYSSASHFVPRLLPEGNLTQLSMQATPNFSSC